MGGAGSLGTSQKKADFFRSEMRRPSRHHTVGGQNPAPVEEQTHIYPRAPSLTLSGGNM